MVEDEAEENDRQEGSGGDGNASGLAEELEHYLSAQLARGVRSLAGGLSGATHSLSAGGGSENDDGGGGGLLAGVVGRIAGGASPVKAAASAGFEGLKQKLPGLGGTKGSGGGQSQSKIVNIVEDIDVGVPVDVAYNQWTQFEQFSGFAKGVDEAEQEDDTTVRWKGHVGPVRRTWTAKISEQVPERRIAWTAQGTKGTVEGVVTFHELAEDLTRVLLVLEYHPKGIVEGLGNLWRAQGRRARLDLKSFRRFVMMRGDSTGEWRGEVHDGEVGEPSGGEARDDSGDGEDTGDSGSGSGEDGEDYEEDTNGEDSGDGEDDEGDEDSLDDEDAEYDEGEDADGQDVGEQDVDEQEDDDADLDEQEDDGESDEDADADFEDGAGDQSEGGQLEPVDDDADSDEAASDEADDEAADDEADDVSEDEADEPDEVDDEEAEDAEAEDSDEEDDAAETK